MLKRVIFASVFLITTSAQAQDPDAGQAAFREIYQEMVEIDSSPTTGSCTKVVRAAEARLHLALACLGAGDEAAAEDHFRRAIAANPEYPDLHLHLGAILERRGAFAEAAAACRVALQRNPRWRRGWLLLALAADGLGESAEAARALEAARDTGAAVPPVRFVD